MWRRNLEASKLCIHQTKRCTGRTRHLLPTSFTRLIVEMTFKYFICDIFWGSIFYLNVTARKNHFTKSEAITTKEKLYFRNIIINYDYLILYVTSTYVIFWSVKYFLELNRLQKRRRLYIRHEWTMAW